MNAASAPARPRRGVSIVSLMVGLVISALVALGLMSLFKATARSSAAARLDTVADEQLVSALLRAQIAAQDAGYGIDSASYGTHLLVLSGAALSGTTLSGTAVAVGSAGNAVLWVLSSGSSVQCAGLLFDSASDGSGGLKRLGPVTCTTAAGITGWASASWASSTWIASPSNHTVDAVSFTAATGTCQPYGLAGLASTLRLTVSGPNSAGVALSDQQCLVNFRS